MNLLLLLITFTVAFQSPTSTQATFDQIKQLEQQYTTSLLKKDDVAFGELLAEDLVHIGFEGQRTGKSQYLTFFKSGNWKYNHYESSKVLIKLHGNVAVVVGEVNRTIEIDGKETSGSFAFTRVWSKVGERWVIVTSQFTTIPASER
jgi:ketosteroid isomerase-like protein